MFTYGFYNSNDHDRVYDANDFSAIFNGIINDGVFLSVGDKFNVTPAPNSGGGLVVSVGSGRAWFNGTWSNNDSELLLELSPADMLEGRIDAVVLSVDSAQRENKIEIISGVTDANPVRPVIPNSETKHCYPLAYVTVDAEANEITAGDIQNVVGLTPTPYVTGILQTANVDNLYSSWEDRFNTWFEGVQGLLDGDVAGNIFNELEKLRKKIEGSSKLPLQNETLVFTESAEKVFINPHAKKILVTCVGPGGNGGPNISYTKTINGKSYYCQYRGGGGGAGGLEIKTFTGPLPSAYVDITVNSNVSSFGKYLSAEKGQPGNYGNGGDSPGMGGGGGGYCSIDYILLNNDRQYLSRMGGGNGGMYGGGGGGGYLSIYADDLDQTMFDDIMSFAPSLGGNGGTYGGGGGSGFLQLSGDRWVDELSFMCPNFGKGGEFGGNGGNIKQGTLYPSTSGCPLTSAQYLYSSPGTNTTLISGLEYTGEGLQGVKDVYDGYDRPLYAGTGENYRQNQYDTYRKRNTAVFYEGLGGGGYGGNGGDIVLDIDNTNYESNTSGMNELITNFNKRRNCGTGGGGYGANGGSSHITGVINGNGYSSYNIVDTNCGTGGGGYGDPGINFSWKNSNNYPCGTGGGGYGADGYGRGGDGVQNISNVNSDGGSSGKVGIVIVQLIYNDEEDST